MTDRAEIDGHTVWVAVGVGSGLGRVKCRKMLWRRLKARLSDVMEDKSLTLAQYLKLVEQAKSDDPAKSKPANDRLLEAKRLPGNWTAARYRGSVRKVADVVGKSCIVLDLDYATQEQIDLIREGLAEVNAWAWFMHTSRSHIPERPRVRLVIPCSRLMTPEEAFAIHRLVSLYLADDPEEAIEIPDLVSFRTNQTMFWPSISKGQEFWTDENIAPILDVDEFLERHPEWTDFESLPYQAREGDRGLKDPTRKMEDPRDKPEPIGAWCRAFTVEDVIERFLSKVYIPGESESETRYTYAPGSASNGAVVYDDGLFLHSNHGTDPIEGSANAWDLVRIHKFGHLDNDAHTNTSPFNLPSHKAMVKLARETDEVVAEEYARIDDVLDDLPDDDDDDEEEEDGDGDEDGGGGEAEPPSDPADILDDLPDEDGEPEKKEKGDKSWMTGLRRKANGDLEPCLANIDLIVKNDRRIKDCIGFNDFTLDPVCFKPIRAKKITTPSRAVPRHNKRHGRRWEEGDDIAIRHICSYKMDLGGYETDFARNLVEEAVLARGFEVPVHPVKDWLEEQHARWKREQPEESYIDRIAQEFLGCPDTPFHRESSRMLCIQAVARIFEPGCKVDTMAIIQGATGSRKSTFWERFFGGFVTELKADLDKTDRVIENMRGFWALEMAEMAAAKRADANTLKSMLSSAVDVHRLAYGRREREFPRQSLFVGTSNEDDYLTDPTSSRRYWVWRTTHDQFEPIDIDRLESVLWIIWGEAVEAYREMRAGQRHGPLWLDLRDEAAIRERDAIAEGSRKRTAVEEIADHIQEWLDRPWPAEDVMIDADGLKLVEYEGDRTPMVRNMVTAQEAFTALHLDEVMIPYRNADVRTYGKALGRVPGWREIGRVRRHGRGATMWFAREGVDGPLWVPAADDDDPLLA